MAVVESWRRVRDCIETSRERRKCCVRLEKEDGIEKRGIRLSRDADDRAIGGIALRGSRWSLE